MKATESESRHPVSLGPAAFPRGLDREPAVARRWGYAPSCVGVGMGTDGDSGLRDTSRVMQGRRGGTKCPRN
ncbi:hypothetical protein TRIP_B10109 [uncultured Desulfatiglans sp.]|nr:hypothetical protein TRIP_B10109 [uncultured Desulfatiglans sp.]